MLNSLRQLPLVAFSIWSRSLPSQSVLSSNAPINQAIRTMKIRSSVKRICQLCVIHVYKGRVYCKCPNPKHMQRQFRERGVRGTKEQMQTK